MPSRRAAALLGLATVLSLWLWQFLTVRYNFGGNWTALFCIRPDMPVPPFLRSERLYVFAGTQGYDGQVYHLIAHDPWMRKGSADAIAGAAFRYQRILVPALAWIIALGQDQWIHAAYFAVILGFAFLGVYWLALVAERAGLPPAWGLAFVLTPAAITSIDRMTADIALAALAAGFAWYAGKKPGWTMLAVLTCAALTRETALPIIGAYALFRCTQKRFIDGLWTAATALPAVAWYLYLSRRAGPSPLPSYLDWVPLSGYIERIVHPTMYALTPAKNTLAMILDYAALAGVALGLVLAARLAIQRRWDAQASAVYALALAAMLIRSRSVWEDAYAFGRVLTPFLLLTGIEFLSARPWIALAPLLLVDARISLNLWSQVAGIAHGIAGL